MKIAVAGTGYVGLVSAVCYAEKGHTVVCVDVDSQKVARMSAGESPIYEPGLEELMKKNKDRITYTVDYASAYAEADVIFICVGTPEKMDGSANLSFVWKVAEQIADSVKHNCVTVVKSTVPLGTNKRLERYLAQLVEGRVSITVASNPEFLSQGTAVRDTLQASRIVVGVNDKESERVMRGVYENFESPLLVTDRESAEMIKYASNDFLALKISYINEIANLCEVVGANIDDVSAGMGLDSRIGNKFLKAGIGYGGSCFPKDTKALHWIAQYHDFELKTVKAAIEINDKQKLKLIKKSRKYYPTFEGLTIAVLGLTFKPETDDLREAPSLVNMPIFIEDGACIQAWDPIGVNNFKKVFPEHINYCKTIEEALTNADVCFIFTEWKAVLEFDTDKFKKLMRRSIVLDGRNCYNVEEMKSKVEAYESIGR